MSDGEVLQSALVGGAPDGFAEAGPGFVLHSMAVVGAEPAFGLAFGARYGTERARNYWYSPEFGEKAHSLIHGPS